MTDTIFPKSHITARDVENGIRRGQQLRSDALFNMISGIIRRRAT